MVNRLPYGGSAGWTVCTLRTAHIGNVIPEDVRQTPRARFSERCTRDVSQHSRGKREMAHSPAWPSEPEKRLELLLARKIMLPEFLPRSGTFLPRYFQLPRVKSSVLCSF